MNMVDSRYIRFAPRILGEEKNVQKYVEPTSVYLFNLCFTVCIVHMFSSDRSILGTLGCENSR